uniref:C2H2-type domain-containing protein n=1 Tax=Callorhinchus milii TaxID=7868 RepID=A0A4W3GU42_CALMI
MLGVNGEGTGSLETKAAPGEEGISSEPNFPPGFLGLQQEFGPEGLRRAGMSSEEIEDVLGDGGEAMGTLKPNLGPGFFGLQQKGLSEGGKSSDTDQRMGGGLGDPLGVHGEQMGSSEPKSTPGGEETSTEPNLPPGLSGLHPKRGMEGPKRAGTSSEATPGEGGEETGRRDASPGPNPPPGFSGLARKSLRRGGRPLGADTSAVSGERRGPSLEPGPAQLGGEETSPEANLPAGFSGPGPQWPTTGPDGPRTLSAASHNWSKTLKCPKCNWHYKYQQTLDAHLREKHPAGGQAACGYCERALPHPGWPGARATPAATSPSAAGPATTRPPPRAT